MAKRKIIKSNWAYVPVLLLIFLAISEVAWYAPYVQPAESALEVIAVDPTDDALSVTFELESNLATRATVVAIPVLSALEDLPVYVFYDERYISVGSDWVFVSRLWEHLEIELKLRGYSAEVKVVDDEGLEDIFVSKERAVVVMAYGSFPSNVFSLDVDLVTPWLDAGGTLVWFGWEAGYYAVDRDQEKFYHGMSNQLYREGVKRLGMDSYVRLTGNSDPSDTGVDRTALSNMLDIRYDLIRCGLLYGKVISSGGLALGKVGEVTGNVASASKVSVAAVQVGKGTVVTFGFFIGGLDHAGDRNDPASFYSISRDVSQILCSGILQSSSDLAPWYTHYQLAAGETQRDSFTLSVRSDVQGVVVYGYNSIESTGLLFFRRYFPL